MAIGKTLVTYTVQITATPESLRKVFSDVLGEIPPMSEVGEKLSGIMTSHLNTLASGGMVLDPKTVKKIETMAGKLREGEQLVPLVEKATSMRGENLVASWEIDPVYLPVLSEYASSRGISVAQLVQQAMDYGMKQGWWFSLPDAPSLEFSAEDWKFLLEAVGLPEGRNKLTGTDVVRHIKANQGAFAEAK